MRIGVDFDNTIVCYDEAFLAVAKQEKLLPQTSNNMSKTDVRDAVRNLANGEYEWQRLQGLVYGKLIMQAKLFEGVEDFFDRAAKTAGIELFIVSHKTELAHHDPLQTNLRTSALQFLESHGFFNRLGLPRQHVFFETTREDKIKRIKELGCNVFIDDLPEVLLDTDFPKSCVPVFFSVISEKTLKNYSSWHEIQRTLETISKDFA